MKAVAADIDGLAKDHARKLLHDKMIKGTRVHLTGDLQVRAGQDPTFKDVAWVKQATKIEIRRMELI